MALVVPLLVLALVGGVAFAVYQWVHPVRVRSGIGSGGVFIGGGPAPVGSNGLTGTVRLSGALSGTGRATRVSPIGGPIGPCSDQARQRYGVSARYESRSPAVDVDITAVLPKGARGPGTWTTAKLPDTVVSVTATSRSDDPREERRQAWVQTRSVPGSATLVLTRDGGGTLTFTGLRPQLVGPAAGEDGPYLPRPLTGRLTWRCGTAG
jgi:hypothetical protein